MGMYSYLLGDGGIMNVARVPDIQTQGWGSLYEWLDTHWCMDIKDAVDGVLYSRVADNQEIQCFAMMSEGI